MATLIVALMLAALCVAAWRDVATRLIPDGAVIALALLGGALRALDGLVALGMSAAASALLFLLLALLSVRGLLGGGDVKLMAAVALALSPTQTVAFVVVTSIAGGLLGCGYLLASRLVGAPTRAPRGAPLLRRILAAEKRRIRRRGPLPYGVAIAVGAAFILLQSRVD